jgi:ubiquinone/menaquinone biosynthesis C-methylase UbiE
MIENDARLQERDRLYRLHGYDSGETGRYVLKRAGRLSGRVLEIGTGKGRFLVQLARKALKVVTVDPDAAEQKFAKLNTAHKRVRHKIRFVVADGADLPFAGSSFDAVVSMNALHHIRNLRGVLREILRVIKPGGKIVLSDFNAHGFRIFDRIHRAEGRTHERVKYDMASIIGLFRRNGWRVTRYSGFCQQVLVATRDAQAR